MIDKRAVEDGLMPAPALISAVKVPDRCEVLLDDFGLIMAYDGRTPDSYEVLYHDATHLPRGADDLIDECRKLPRTNIPPAVIALAAGLRANSAKATVEAVVRHLQAHFNYSLSPGAFRDKYVDPVVEFLLEKQEGYCAYFASAAALLLRLAAIPARFVGGFLAHPNDWDGDYVIVRRAHAHAWVEALVEDGWTRVDPTPAADYRNAHHHPQPQRPRAGRRRPAPQPEPDA
jgi:transglutaminase-like putative cysteine protease